MKIVLASASERRVELLKRIIDDFSVVVSDFNEESINFDGDFCKYVIELSKGKAASASRKIIGDVNIIACDTIVACKGRVLGKPINDEDAIDMLKMLSGTTHQVYSGITILNTKTERTISDYIKTDVKFSGLTEEEIISYVKSGEGNDKAGSYGIQGFGGVFVEEIHGDYYSVVGLPLNRLKYMLRDMGVNL